jgi:hypothetical protein
MESGERDFVNTQLRLAADAQPLQIWAIRECYPVICRLRSRGLTMKKKAMAFLAVALSTAFGLLITEIVFRLALPPVPGEETSAAEYVAAAQRNPGAPRLFPAGYKVVFDIRGLYQGADKVMFHVGPNRFVAPEPKGKSRYAVLFLGGSVTEGIFLQDHDRWPARLNVDGEVATYNAGMSEAGMLGQYLTAQYLAEHGYSFDLVVLATNQNDSTWSRRFAEINSRYSFPEFSKGLKHIFEKEFVTEKEEGWISLRTVAWARHFIRVARLGASKASDAFSSGSPPPRGSKAPSIVVEALSSLLQGKQNLPNAKLDECLDSNSPRKFTQLYYEDLKENFPEFKREMKRLLGAELLVVSEPSSYGAPANSFYFTDLRVPMTCTTRDGLRSIEQNEAVDLMRERARVYLEAARMAGAHTFDLAGAMEPYSDGPEGGSFFYDSMHPTPRGAEKFAEILRPAIKEVLEAQKKL